MPTPTSSSKEYKVHFWCVERIFQISGIILLYAVGIFTVFKSIPNELWLIWAGVGIFLGGLGLHALLNYGIKIRVVLTSDQLILKHPGKTMVTDWQNILRIEEVWGTYSGGRSYFVRTPHGIIGIPGTMEHCNELMAIIQQRSGKRIISEWRGAKDSLREEWRALLRWLATHRLAVVLIVLCMAGLGALAMQWLRSEYQVYHPTQHTLRVPQDTNGK